MSNCAVMQFSGFTFFFLAWKKIIKKSDAAITAYRSSYSVGVGSISSKVFTLIIEEICAQPASLPCLKRAHQWMLLSWFPLFQPVWRSHFGSLWTWGCKEGVSVNAQQVWVVYVKGDVRTQDLWQTQWKLRSPFYRGREKDKAKEKRCLFEVMSGC